MRLDDLCAARLRVPLPFQQLLDGVLARPRDCSIVLELFRLQSEPLFSTKGASHLILHSVGPLMAVVFQSLARVRDLESVASRSQLSRVPKVHIGCPFHIERIHCSSLF